jgi:O-antigen ligase
VRNKLEIVFIVVLSLLFIAANSYFAIKEKWLFSAIPFILLAGFWILFAPEKLFFALVFLAPLSITLRRLVPGLTFDFWFPTEPILVFLLGLLILKSLQERYFRKELFSHPVFISILFYLGWILIAIFPSELPIVSIKYFLVRFWFIGIFFYLAYILFRRNEKNIKWFLWAYIVGIFIVSIYSLLKHASKGLLDHYAAHQASAPFFIDHTSFGAALAFAIPVMVAFSFNARSKTAKYICWALSGFFLISLVFSYSRAAWLSLVFGAGIWVIILLKIKFRTLIILCTLIVALFFTFSNDIIWLLQRNTTDSSGDFVEHMQSVANVNTDASNLERLNRWDAAMSMFMERPVFGWGPGTYQFLYAPFQKSYKKTVISTNFGTGGNAHSEYLGLMSESGFFAMLGYVLVLFFALFRGFKLIARVNSGEYRNLLVACIVGLLTYIFHGFLNNFLDADKIAVLFWGYIAVIVAMDMKYGKNEVPLATEPEGNFG